MPTSGEAIGIYKSHTAMMGRNIHSNTHLRLLITHQWSAGEVVYVERIHFQLEVNTVGMLGAAEQDNK